MDFTVTARHVPVSERFRGVCKDKLAKVEQYAPRTQRIEVVVSEETSRGAPKGSIRVEITCLAKGPVIRAEAYAEDKWAALDLAVGKLAERLRRANDRRKISRRRGGPDLDQATADLQIAALGGADEAPAPEGETDEDGSEMDRRLGAAGERVVNVREKIHSSPPMTLDQALYSMELVGHDFFLFHDQDTDRPSVVYRRRGWDYGVIHLQVTHQDTADVERDVKVG